MVLLNDAYFALRDALSELRNEVLLSSSRIGGSWCARGYIFEDEGRGRCR